MSETVQASKQRLATRGAEVILVTREMRLEWIDTLALDLNVSPVMFRVACAISRHINRNTGATFIKQTTIAKVLGISGRTVWAAIGGLEARGYLIVRRRELGVRLSDGRRVCGGRGVANEYFLAFERSKLVATKRGLKLAARCDLIWEERSQKQARKVATHCDPTLNLSSISNPSPPTSPRLVWGAAAPSTDANPRLSEPHRSWLAVKEWLARPENLGSAIAEAWIEKLALFSIVDGIVTLAAPSKFFARRVGEDYAAWLANAWRAVEPSIVRVEVMHPASNRMALFARREPGDPGG